VRATINCRCGYHLPAEFPDAKDTQTFSFECPSCGRPLTLKVVRPHWASVSAVREQADDEETCSRCGGAATINYVAGQIVARCLNKCTSSPIGATSNRIGDD